MKKTLTLFSSLLFLSLAAQAQNLVPNYSFEDTVACPTSIDQVYNSTGWSSFGNTSDYFNSCSTGNVSSVPNNFFGYQFAHSGNAYCGLYNYTPPPSSNYREYIGTQLSDSMLIGSQYFISFYTNLSNMLRCKSNKIGIRFSTVSYSSVQPPLLNNWAHLFSQSLISDTVNWVFISGSFIADSNYKYIIIGNFFDNANTDTLDCGPTPGTVSYLYIDDVCVSTDSFTCNNIKEGIPLVMQEEEIKLYPNPSEGSFYLDNPVSFEINEIKIYDAKLNAVEFYFKKIYYGKYLVRLINPSDGIYFIYALSKNERYFARKIIINH